MIAGATAIVEARGTTRAFRAGGGTVPALRGVDLQIQPGELVALMGRSSSGKTTLFNLLVGLDRPTAGRVLILGQDPSTLNEIARARLRREQIGILFQNAHLFPALTAQENVEIPLHLAGIPTAARPVRP